MVRWYTERPSGGLKNVEMAENHDLQLMGRGMNNNAKQGGIEEFAGPGTGIRRRLEMGRE